MSEAARQQLEGPRCPPDMAYLWRWYRELEAGRQAGMTGPAPLTWEAIAAWALLTWTRPTRPEVMALRDLDLAYLKVMR